MQGLHDFIPTKVKIAYINQLLKVGFDTIDFGSFVSPKAIPQLRDTAEVLAALDLDKSNSKLLAIVANKRGAEEAVAYEEINYLGFPLSISEEFQKRNTNKSIADAMSVVSDIQEMVTAKGKEQVVYISMGFGNPYGEAFNDEIVAEFVDRLVGLGIKNISLADTIGVAEPEIIKKIFKTSITAYPTTEIGAHFHSTPDRAMEKIEAAYQVGCRRFDAAIKGFGGCPMAKDDLTGNLATETLLAYLDSINEKTSLDRQAFAEAMHKSLNVFPQG